MTGGRAYSPRTDPRDIVDQLLEQGLGEGLCDACLALAASCSLTEMRAITEALARRVAAVERGDGCCESCRRDTTVTSIRSP
jgi:hypothetical protein